jgi:hypothetical protein
MKVFKTTHFEQDYIENRKENMNESIEKFYGNTDFKDKFILILNADFYLRNFIPDTGSFKFFGKNNEIIIDSNNIKTKIRSPYPNKNIHQISARIGNKCCNFGVPFLFETFEEIQQIKRVVIDWRYAQPLCSEHLSICTEINFETPQNPEDRVYYLYFYDNLSIKNIDDFSCVTEKMFNQYSEICQYQFIDYKEIFKTDFSLNGQSFETECNPIKAELTDKNLRPFDLSVKQINDEMKELGVAGYNLITYFSKETVPPTPFAEFVL